MAANDVEIAWLEIADDPQLWRSIGYRVDDHGRCIVAGVEHRLVGASDERRGLCGWAVRAEGAAEGTVKIDGLVTQVVGPMPDVARLSDAAANEAHPNGVTGFDHLVMTTPDTPRTAAALEAFGLERRGHRDTNSAGDRVHMTFFWVGRVLLELVGPGTPDPADSGRPARFSGIAYVSDDLEATADFLGERSTVPRDAVQPGRRICALQSEAGSSLPMAFMTPHVKAG